MTGRAKLSSLVVLALSFAALAPVHVAHAQALPAWLRVRAADVPHPEPAQVPPAPGPEVHRSARRGAYMIAVGTGLIAAGVANALILGRQHACPGGNAPKTPIVFGALASVSGLALLVAGALRLKYLPPANTGVRDGILLPLTAGATGLVGFATNTLVAIPELIGCSLD